MHESELTALLLIGDSSSHRRTLASEDIYTKLALSQPLRFHLEEIPRGLEATLLFGGSI